MNLEGGTTANAEVFYPATDNHHPDPGHLQTPNFFYYYKQVFDPGGFTYEDTDASHTHLTTGEIHIGNDAHGPWAIRLFVRGANGHIVHIPDDWLAVGGIHNFVHAVAHERAHKRHYEEVSWTLEYFDWYPPAPGVDDDRDRVFDVDEENLFGLWPDMSDSTGAYANLPPDHPDYGREDRECIADIEALGHLLPEEGLSAQDWADDGLQRGSRDEAKFPWWYWLKSVPPLNQPCHAHLQTPVR
ncbi:MAG: hypothetical protein HY321_07470 [Armatimonadetes bacterium]|nr:hypothetical protein [Armatimonadota bacterium]